MLSRLKDADKFGKTLIRMLRMIWQAHPPIFLSLILLTAVQALTPLASAWITKLLFDLLALALLGSPSAELWRDLIFLLLAQGVVFIIVQVCVSSSTYLNNELGRKLALLTETSVYKKISSFSGIRYFEDPEFYDTFRLASQGAQFGPLQSLGILTGLFQNIITIITFLALLLAFNPLLAMLVILAALPQFWSQLKFSRQRYGLAFDLSPNERRAFYTSHLLSAVETAQEVRLFGLAEYLLDNLRALYHKIHQAQRRQELHELRWKLALETFSAATFAVAFGIVALQAFAKRMSLGDITLYINAMRSLQDGLSSMFFAIAGINEYILFFNEYDRLMALPQSISTAHLPRSLPELSQGIEFCNVSFRYGESYSWVLRNLNLFMPANKTLALVGSNGAGKTTLMKLLARLYDPSEGEILWDGVDIRELDLDELRSNIGMIFQDFVRYAFTAQENIGIGQISQVNDLARIHRSAKIAGIHQLVETLPQGYQTLLSRAFGENSAGVDLSGGEWQKVALARLFMRDARVLVLDEPTAWLDAQGEYEIYNCFTELIKGKTGLLISHRFSTVCMADMIAVLENGSISEYGIHSDLLARGGAYARLYHLQADRYQTAQ
jgi:ATP-binding cassette, subfamily B, bacterial